MAQSLFCALLGPLMCATFETQDLCSLKPLTHNFSFASHIIAVTKRGNGHKYSLFLLKILNLLNDQLYYMNG